MVGIRLVHMLTDLGGIECEMTVTRFAEDRFYINSAIMGQSHDLDWLVQSRAHRRGREPVRLSLDLGGFA